MRVPPARHPRCGPGLSKWFADALAVVLAEYLDADAAQHLHEVGLPAAVPHTGQRGDYRRAGPYWLHGMSGHAVSEPPGLASRCGRRVCAVDWHGWHDDYDRPGSSLARRLEAVQTQVSVALGSAPPGLLRAISLTSGRS
jgi:hypothetical protein